MSEISIKHTQTGTCIQIIIKSVVCAEYSPEIQPTKYKTFFFFFWDPIKCFTFYKPQIGLMWSREGSISSHQSQTERLTCAHKGDDCTCQCLILLADVRGPCQQNEMLYSGESSQTSPRIKNITHGGFNK